MKKLLISSIGAAALISTCAAYSALDNNYANQFLKIKKDKSELEMSISTFTTNSKIPSNIKSLTLGYSGELAYNINKNLYLSGNLKYYGNKNFSYGATAGITASKGILLPYAEISYDQFLYNKQKTHAEFGYDVGAVLNVNKYINPYVQLDDFLNKDINKEMMEVGSQFLITDNVAFKVGYSFGVQNNKNSANIKLIYIF